MIWGHTYNFSGTRWTTILQTRARRLCASHFCCEFATLNQIKKLENFVFRIHSCTASISYIPIHIIHSSIHFHHWIKIFQFRKALCIFICLCSISQTDGKKKIACPKLVSMVSYSIIQVNHTMMKGTQKSNQIHERSCQIQLQRKISKWSFWSWSSLQLSKLQKGIFFSDFSTCLSFKFD